MQIRVALTLIVTISLGAFAGEPVVHAKPMGEREGIDFFEKKIRPVLVTSCYECHSVETGKSKGGLLLDSREALLKGGNTGPAIVPGHPEKSLLVKAIRHAEEELEMPPKTRLPDQQVSDFEDWIRDGAFDPRKAKAPVTGPYKVDFEVAKNFWAFQPVKKTQPPAVQNAAAAPTPIDRFLQAKREEKGLPTGKSAEKAALIRRATFDLIGLPPTPEEVDAFVNDSAPSAFTKLIDRLLASPAYGERWGRHWLDVVRYSDTAGDSADYPIVEAVKYRNWVIDAYNKDMPYDQFVREQLAGDLMPSDTDAQRYDRIVATGYVALARRFGVQPQYQMHLTIEDTLDTVGRSLFGLSISCARCHDHKFDPIPTQDYYSLYGFFSSSRFPFAGSENDQRPKDFVPLLPKQESETRIAEIQKKLKDLDALADGYEKERKATEKLPADKITPEERKKKVEELKKKNTEAKKEFEKFFAESWVSWPKAFAMAEGEGKNVKVHKRGEPGAQGEDAPRRNLKIFGGQALPADVKGSGRLQLAQMFTDPSNPLFARVMVNRLWHHHFGQGIVQTPNDFGKQGKPPTHPEMLDFLATRFVESGYSIKAMHREIMQTAAYQMSSAQESVGVEKDPNNEYLWRFNRRRLDAEQIRDAVLAVSGSLDPKRAEVHPFPAINTWKFTQHAQFFGLYENNQRSVYQMVQRLRRHPYLSLFDGADAAISTGARPMTTTPLQALFMMNDKFTHEKADAFASRLTKSESDAAKRVQLAYRLAFGRNPAADELQSCTEYLAKAGEALKKTQASPEMQQPMAWSSFARALLGSNEFMFLD